MTSLSQNSNVKKAETYHWCLLPGSVDVFFDTICSQLVNQLLLRHVLALWCVWFFFSSWFSTPASCWVGCPALPWFKANLAASLLIRWPRRFVGLVWNWLLCFQNALMKENVSLLILFPPLLCDWCIYRVVLNVCVVLLNPRGWMAVCVYIYNIYICVCVRSQLGNLSWGLTVTKRPCVRVAPSAVLAFSTGTTAPYSTVNKTSTPILLPVVEQLLSGFSDPIGFDGESRW